MSTTRRYLWIPTLLLWASPLLAQHHHGSATPVSYHGHSGHSGVMMSGIGGGGGGMSHNSGSVGLGVVSGGYAGYYGGIGGGFGGGYYGSNFLFAQPIFGGFSGLPPIVPLATQPFLNVGQAMVGQGGQGMGGGGLMLPMPPAQPSRAATVARARRAGAAKARELVQIAARQFRVNNLTRASDRYQQAIKADPFSPIPHVHLAQVSIIRGDYNAAAEHLRTAVSVADGPGWLLTAPDVQSLYSEPADFAKQLAKLETHLQANPNDRNAWFVLGAQWYFSGRTQQASDLFQRLTDRRPDQALSAFMDAATPARREQP